MLLWTTGSCLRRIARRCRFSRLLPDMSRFPGRAVVLLIDCDGDSNRPAEIVKQVPTGVRDRVFVLGSLMEPKDLRREIGPLETVGRQLADDCRRDEGSRWNHPLLAHNMAELQRSRTVVREILFG